MMDMAEQVSRCAVPWLVCLLRARAATLAGQTWAATGWAILGTLAVMLWPGVSRMHEALGATRDA